MSQIKITYIEQDLPQVKKVFSMLMIWYDNNKATVLAAMKNNPIAVANQNLWHAEIDTKVMIISPWVMGANMIRGYQCTYLGVVYNIVQTHVVNNPTFTPPTVLSLYRPAQVTTPGRKYPRWNSIGLMDSVNFWKLNDRVDHNSKYWLSKNAVNTWEPGTVATTIWIETT